MGVLEELADFAKKYPRLREACRQEAERQLEQSFEQLNGYIFTNQGKMPILNDEEMEFCKSGKKLNAVKNYRERNECGLIFAKHFVEHFGFPNEYNHTESLGLS